MFREWIEVGGLRLEVARWKQDAAVGLPILLLHEGLGSIQLWKSFPEKLASATGREVIAWSRNGHGWSEWETPAHDPVYMHAEAMLLAEIHRALGIDRSHWLGHSDGGSIALIGAGQHPELGASLILEAPHVFVEDLTVRNIEAARTSLNNPEILARMGKYHASPERVLQRWLNVWLNPRFRDWNIEEALCGLACPALLIQGMDDQYGTLEQLDRISEALPQCERLEIEMCAHSPHFDRETVVLAAIRIFLTGRD